MVLSTDNMMMILIKYFSYYFLNGKYCALLLYQDFKLEYVMAIPENIMTKHFGNDKSFTQTNHKKFTMV